MAGRRCAGRLAAGSHLGRTGAGLHSRFASGPLTAAPRLAGPIDSLVRVSRRVGKARHNRPRTRGAISRPTPARAGTAAPPPPRTVAAGGARTGGPGGPARGRRSSPGQARPVVHSSVGPPAQPRPGCRLSDRPPRRGAGVAGGTPPGRPMPATVPNRSRAPRPGKVHAARRGGATGPRPNPEEGAGTADGTAPAALNLPGPI